MWTRKIIKTRAKEILRISYWKAFLVSLIIAFVGGNSGGCSLNSSWNVGNDKSQDIPGYLMQSNGEIFSYGDIALIVVGIVVILFIFALRILVGYPLEIGGRRYFSQASQKNIDLNVLGYAFEKDKYLDIIKAMLWRDFINFLWYLVLIIPGIIKSYAYRMVPYILADNPNIGYKRALELSKNMSSNQKFKIFILDISFIGWYLLGTLAFFIGIIFVMPYVNTTAAELYLVLRQNALDKGLCSYDELLLSQVE